MLATLLAITALTAPLSAPRRSRMSAA
jgi:hypothetical protein